MTRPPYIAPASRLVAPIRPDTPVAGYYLTKLARGGPDVCVRIWHDRPLDPGTMAIMDRAPRWQMELDGNYVNRGGEPWSEEDVIDTYIFASKRPITPEEYSYRRARAGHAAEHEPNMAEANPTKPVNLMKIPTPW